MSAEKKKVIEKIAQQVNLAYQSGTPFILIDTEELELVEEAALESKTVDLLRAEEKDSSERFWQSYYSFLREEGDDLSCCTNYCTSPVQLRRVLPGGERTSLFFKNREPCLFVLHLTELSWRKQGSDPAMVEALRTYVKEYLRCKDRSSVVRTSCVILYGRVELLPADLQSYTEIIEVDLPDTAELMELVTSMAEENATPIELDEGRREITHALSGFGLMDARRILQRLLWSSSPAGTPLLFTDERDHIILEAKKQVLLQGGGLLELVRGAATEESGEERNRLGGMSTLRAWIQDNRERARNADKYLRYRGVQRLKGILLCGIPGCGKSEAAMILRQSWGLPMVQMSVDRLMGGLVGESERNMRQALKQAEAMAPCIVWIDELDKGFSASSRGNQDSAVFKRMFGYFLTWMQSNTRPCFIYATANDIGKLPSELFRSGRFDALFSVFMPTHEECISIFQEQMHRLQRRSRKEAKRWDSQGELLFERACFAHETLERIMESFVHPETLERSQNIKFVNGADIEKIVEKAMMTIRADALTAAKQSTDLDALDEALRIPKPITPSQWHQAVRKVIQDPTVSTYGGSPANLNSITACYIRLMQGNFVPAGKELLDGSAYQRIWDEEKGESRISYQPSEAYLNGLHPYDRALHDAIADRMERIATRMEHIEFERLLV